MRQRILSLVTAVAVAAIGAPVATAQTPASPSPVAPATAKSAGDPATVLVQIHDLALLHALQPLKLSKAQIDGLLAPLREVVEGDADRRKRDTEALQEIATEVAQARTDALAGAALSSELEKRVAAMTKDSKARLDAARKAAIEKLLPVITASFNEAQKAEIDAQSRAFFGGRRVPAQYRNNPAKAPKEAVQELALRAFIENVLLDDRTLPLLEQMKPGESASAAPAATP